jgi:hypothetical protein
MASVGRSIGERSVTGQSGFFSYAMLKPTDQGAAITLGGKTVQVTTTEITWANGGRLQLPANWAHLELAESFNSIVVRVDGTKLASIQPAVKAGANVISQAM